VRLSVDDIGGSGNLDEPNVLFTGIGTTITFGHTAVFRSCGGCGRFCQAQKALGRTRPRLRASLVPAPGPGF
jgi:hypothetical protein